MAKIAIIMLAAAIALGVAVRMLSGTSQPAPQSAVLPAPAQVRPAPAGGDDAAQRLQMLEGLVNEEARERLVLTEEVAALREQVERLERALTPADRPPAPPGDPGFTGSAPASGPRELTVQGLVAAGFSSGEAERVKARFDQVAMDRLYLRDRAMREGWMGSERYAREAKEVELSEQRLEQELGADDYDRYLYAVGRPNRVVVRSVMANSPASAAGIETGDVILRYGDQRLRSTRQLGSATLGGQAGASVSVEVLRDGQRMELFLPRGPMGVSLGQASLRPDS